MTFDENKIACTVSEKGFHQIVKAKVPTWVNSALNEGIELIGGKLQTFAVIGLERNYDALMSLTTQELLAILNGAEMESQETAEINTNEIVISENISGEVVKSFQDMTVEQRLIMLSKTDKQHIKQRKGRAGMNYNYVTGHHMHTCANLAFMFMWDSEIDTIDRYGDEIICIGSVSGMINGVRVQHAGIGQADVKFKKGTKDVLCLGDDYKAAMTDMEKKGLSKFEIAADVYRGDV